ncbi:hypothetical protein MD484_g1983, partial [Candolleomyces efflorescens]
MTGSDMKIPLDVFYLILNEIKAADRKPLVFEDLKMRITRETATKIRDQLPAIASGRSPYTRWTKRVSLDRMVPVEIFEFYGYTVGDFTNETERKAAFECQSLYLAPAIQALKNVESASYHGTEKGPYLDVLLSLAKLPKLRELSLSLNLYDDDTPYPLDEFSQLRTLKFHAIPISPTILSAASRMIARCPDLAELHVFPTINSYKAFRNGGNPVRAAVNVETIFEDSVRSSTFVPSLKKLSAKGNGFKFSSTALPYLRALVHLELEENVDASFWQALASSQVHLSHLTVDPASPGLFDYLISYSSLKDLHFQGLPRVQAIEVPAQFFHQLASDFWAITREHLTPILECQSLRTLSILYHYPDKHPFSTVETEWTQDNLSTDSVLELLYLLNSVADGLPDLRKLILKPTTTAPEFGFLRNGLFDSVQLMNEEIWKEICGLDLTVSRNFPLELRLTNSEDMLSIGDVPDVSSIPLCLSPGDHCFKPLVT